MYIKFKVGDLIKLPDNKHWQLESTIAYWRSNEKYLIIEQKFTTDKRYLFYTVIDTSGQTGSFSTNSRVSTDAIVI